MGSAVPTFKYNSVSNRWELIGKGGSAKLYIPDVNSLISQVKVYSAVMGSVAVGTGSKTVGTATVTGLTTDDRLIVNVPSMPAVVGGARVVSANLLELQLANPSSVAAIAQSEATFGVIAIRKE